MTYKIADRKFVLTPLEQLEEETYNNLLVESNINIRNDARIGFDNKQLLSEMRVFAKQIAKNNYLKQMEN